MNKNTLSWLTAFLILGLWPKDACAHGVSSSYTTLTVSDNQAAVEVAFGVPDMIAHFGLDADQDQRVSPQEVASVLPQFLPVLNRYLQIKLNGTVMPLSAAEAAAVAQPASGMELFVLRARLDAPGGITEAAVSLSTDFFEKVGQNHSHFVKVVYAGQTQQAFLSLAQPEHTFNLSRPD